MTSAIFKSTGAIIIYSIVSIGILAIAGYNFWGWFGGSDYYKSNHPNPNAGGTGVGATGSTGSSGRESFAGGENVSQPSSENSSFSSRSIQPPQQIINCKEEKLINGVKHILWGVQHSGSIYYAVWANSQTWHNTTTPITKQEYDNLKAKCFGTITTYPPTLNHACNTTFKVGPHGITYKFSGVALQGPVFGSGGMHSFGDYRAVYTATVNIPPPPHSAYPMYENPYYYPITKQEYDSLKNCFKNNQIA